MPRPSQSQYLDSKVLTASQTQLQVMLLDGAMRFGNQAKKMWTSGSEFKDVDLSLTRMVDIVDALTHGAAEGTTEFSKQLEEQYAFVYRELAACRINQDMKKLESCLALLEYQRKTWKLACDKLAVETAAVSKAPALPGMHVPMSSTSSLSLEA